MFLHFPPAGRSQEKAKSPAAQGPQSSSCIVNQRVSLLLRMPVCTQSHCREHSLQGTKKPRSSSQSVETCEDKLVSERVSETRRRQLNQISCSSRLCRQRRCCCCSAHTSLTSVPSIRIACLRKDYLRSYFPSCWRPGTGCWSGVPPSCTP